MVAKMFAQLEYSAHTLLLNQRNLAIVAHGLTKRNKASHHSGSGEDSG